MEVVHQCAAGLDVDKQQITIAARATDLVGGAMFLNALREGAFDGAIGIDEFAAQRAVSTVPR